MKFLLLALLFSTSVFAKSYNQTFSNDDFYKAKTGTSFLRFDMKSTKMGMITTDFYGVAKKFAVSFDLRKKTIKNAVVSFKVADLDTDVNDRNKKMYNLCFEKNKYPHLIVTLNNSIRIGKNKKTIPATMNVRGKNKAINVLIETVKKGKRLIVTGVSQVSLKELEIPDPSIWIAKVDDKVELKFNFEVSL